MKIKTSDMTDAMLLEVVGSYRRSYQGLRNVHESCRKNIVAMRTLSFGDSKPRSKNASY